MVSFSIIKRETFPLIAFQNFRKLVRMVDVILEHMETLSDFWFHLYMKEDSAAKSNNKTRKVSVEHFFI